MRAARFLLLTAVLVACAFADESAPGLTPDFNAEDPAANAHPLPYSKEQLHKLPNSVLHRMLHDRGVICKDCGDKSTSRPG